MSKVMRVPFNGQSMGTLIQENDDVEVALFNQSLSLLEIEEQQIINPGQIVLLKDKSEWIIHRLIKIEGLFKSEKNVLITKGDLNKSYDKSNVDLIVWGVVTGVYRNDKYISWPFSNLKYNSLMMSLSKSYNSKAILGAGFFIRKFIEVFGLFGRQFYLSETYQFFLAKLKNKNSPELNAKNIEGFRKISERHFLQNYLYNRISFEEKEKFPDWKKNRKIEALRNQMIINELKELGVVLTEEKLLCKPCIVKGASLLGRVYKDFAERIMSDVDVYISVDEKSKIEGLLTSKGYQLIDVNHGKANKSKSMWSKPLLDSKIVIELHTKLYWLEVVGEKWEIEKSEINGFNQLVLIDEIIYLSIHLVYSHSFQRLFWLVDIYELLEKHKDEIDWIELWDRATELKAKKAVKLSLYAIKLLFSYCPLGSESKVSPMLKALIIKSFLLAPYKSMPKYLIIKHLVQHSLFDAFKYDFHRLVLIFSRKVSSIFSANRN